MSDVVLPDAVLPDVVLSVEGVSKVFPPRRRKGEPTTAVDGMSFVATQGASIGVVGESGSGKTTLARLLVGLEQPTTGVITIGGKAMGAATSRRDRMERARWIQMVFQDPYTSLDPQQTVAKCLDEVLALHTGLPAAGRAQRAADLLDQVGLAERVGDAVPGALSGGQRQRVAIARALATGPKILVLDEAVSALDVSVQSQVLNLLADLRAAQALTYLFISHDLAVIRQVCDEVLVMRHGTCVERGVTEDVLASPAHEYTRLLLDSVPRPGWAPARVWRPHGEENRDA